MGGEEWGGARGRGGEGASGAHVSAQLLVLLRLAREDMALLVDHLHDLGAAQADEADALREGDAAVDLAAIGDRGGDREQEDHVVPG